MKLISKATAVLFVSVLFVLQAGAQPKFKDLRIASPGLPAGPSFRELRPGQAAVASLAGPASIANSCFVYGNGCSLVPVNLLDFTAVRADDETAALSWHTAMETGVLGYHVERSLDPRFFFAAREFVTAAWPEAAENEYRYNDANDLTVKSYYRLRIAHTDGSFTFSEIETVLPVKETTGLLVYPNPASDLLNVRIRVNKNTTAMIVLQDAAGRQVKQWSVNLTKGTNIFPENISRLAAGAYHVVVIRGEEEKMVTSFFKY